MFAGYWSKVTDPNNPIAVALNSRPKYVASRTLERVTWNNSRLIRGDLVAELQKLREQPGTGVHTWGSTGLMQTLLKHDLVDELRTWVYPVRLGRLTGGCATWSRCAARPTWPSSATATK